jgi:outer membrane protein W
MKKLMLSFALLAAMSFSSSKLNAQSTNYKPFKVDVAFGYAKPAGSGSKGGVVFALEPKYAVSNAITLGLRFESAVTASAIEVDGESFTGDVKGTSSYLLTGDYFFKETGFRPFIGAGVGLYSLAGIEIGDEDLEIGGKTKFGFAPRLGFETGHFRAAVEYNVAGKNLGANYNYLAFKIGFFLGGGKK